MVLRPAIVHGRVGVDWAFFMLRIADEVHAGRVVERWGHCLKMKDDDTERGRTGEFYGLGVGERVNAGLWGLGKVKQDTTGRPSNE